jgi:hypothetical protein
MSSRPAAPDPVGQLVDVGGYRLHLACQGEGGPTVVMVEELHTLPVTAQLPGPYVLVGHSFGGLLVRLYAARRPPPAGGGRPGPGRLRPRRPVPAGPSEIRELLSQFEEQARQQFEGLKALMESGSLDVAMLRSHQGCPRRPRKGG